MRRTRRTPGNEIVTIIRPQRGRTTRTRFICAPPLGAIFAGHFHSGGSRSTVHPRLPCVPPLVAVKKRPIGNEYDMTPSQAKGTHSGGRGAGAMAWSKIMNWSMLPPSEVSDADRFSGTRLPSVALPIRIGRTIVIGNTSTN